MKNKRNSNLFLKTFILCISLVTLAACSNTTKASNNDTLEEGAVYIGKAATNEIIEVDSPDQWTIKFQNEDDNTYSVVSVEDTDQTIGDYPVKKLVADEIYGDSSPFAKREGRDYIITQDDEGVYFIVVSEETLEEHTEGIVNNKNPDQYIKDQAKYTFSK